LEAKQPRCPQTASTEYQSCLLTIGNNDRMVSQASWLLRNQFTRWMANHRTKRCKLLRNRLRALLSLLHHIREAHSQAQVCNQGGDTRLEIVFRFCRWEGLVVESIKLLRDCASTTSIVRPGIATRSSISTSLRRRCRKKEQRFEPLHVQWDSSNPP